jgi:MFS family permease
VRRVSASGDAATKRLTLIACIIGSGIVTLDGTVVTVALPSIQRALGGGLAAQQWVANGYLLTLGSLILIGGSLGDLYGERRIFALGVCGFGVTSRRRSARSSPLAPSRELPVRCSCPARSL